MNNYHVYEEIGKGKYSNVYKGRKKKSIEYVAVKGLEKSRLKKLLNEVKMFSDLKHPNILKFYSWYESRNHLWVILEYCPGGDLMSLIKADSKGLGESTTRTFIREICSGIMYLHSKGIIYCDLKPSNILFNEYGNVKISDLGLAKCLVDLITSSQADEFTAQRDMSKRGSPYYMSPELFQDGGVYSFQSDLWAIGCVAYELATGQPPFVSNSFTELVNLILNAELVKVDNYSAQFNEFIRGLLEKDPSKRWSWDRLCKHPFLGIQPLSIPPQPHYHNWLSKQGAQRLQNSTPIQQQSKSPVDILRLSLNVKKNLLREEPLPYEKTTVAKVDRDVKLVDRDQEVDIGSGDEMDDEKEIEDTDSIPTPQSPNLQKPLNNKENIMNLSQKTPNTPNTPLSQSPMLEGYTPQMKNNTSNASLLVPLEQLFTHSSDTTVKPIIGNREIERMSSTSEHQVVKESLPFAYIPTDDVNKNIESEVVEQHFENIYNALASPSVSLNEKLNIATYFEQIVQSSNCANRLLNSAFTPLLLKLLRNGKSGAFKLRVCSTIGLLIRHATVIDQDVAQMGIVESMVEILNSREAVLVRRKACAALGEYLFYGATQMDEDANNICWEMNNGSYNALLKVLKNSNEDEIIKSYSVKTIENISSQSLSTGYMFATVECVEQLILLFLVAKNDNLKSSCAIAIANIVLLDNKLVDMVLHKLGLSTMVGVFMDGSPRIQQAMITIFNLFLIQSLNSSAAEQDQIHQVAINTINGLLMEESQLLSSLVHMLDHATPVSRGKAALSIMFIIKFNVTTLVALSDEHLRFYAVVEKGTREQNDYFKSCLSHLLAQLTECIPWMINAVQDEIKGIIGGEVQQDDDNSMKKKTSRKVSTHSEAPKLKGNLCYLQVLLQYASIGCLQSSLFTGAYIPSIVRLIQQSPTLSQAQHYLFNIISFLPTNPRVLVKQQEMIINGVFKACIEQMSVIQVTESRFLFLNFIIELSNALLSEEAIYDSPGFLKQYAIEINKVVVGLLLPQLKQLLSEQPPLPFYALKLISILLGYNPGFLLSMKKNKIINSVLDMYRVDSNNITGHTLTVVQKLIDGSTVDDIFQMNVIEKSTSIFTHFIQNHQEWSYDDISGILTSLTTKVIAEFSRGKTSQAINPETTLQPVAFPHELLSNVFTITNI